MTDLGHATRTLPFSRVGTSSIHLRYLDDDPDLIELLPRRHRDAADLVRDLPRSARRLVPRRALSQALVSYATRHGAGPAALEAARRVEQEDVLFVITGQQPGVFGGPLYTLHKVITAVKLCREIAKVPGAPPVVPLFWNHTEDHDWGEVNHTFLVNPAQELQRFRLDLVHDGQPVRDVPVGDRFEATLSAALENLPVTEFRDLVTRLYRPERAEDTLGTLQARLLFQLFAGEALLVIEPRDLPGEAFDVLAKFWSQASPIRSAVRRTADRIADIDLDVTVDLDGPLLFSRAGGRRVAIPDGDPLPRPELVSPGVLLRPLWQDACLPTAAYVCGPGELSYLVLSQPLYKLLGVPAPALVPRASITLLEGSLQKLLTRFGWDLADLAQGPEALASAVSRDGATDLVEDRIADLAQHVERGLTAAEEEVRKVDQSLLGPLERSRGKVKEELEKLALKIRNHRQNREGTGLRQIRRLCANLRPRGQLQERVLPALPFLNLHGQSLVPMLVNAIDPFARGHYLVEL